MDEKEFKLKAFGPEPLNQRSIEADEVILRQLSRKTSTEEVQQRGVEALIKNALWGGWVLGYGLAAIQVGIPIRMAWYWMLNPGKTFEEQFFTRIMINPEIIEKEDMYIKAGEGCLSLPGKSCETRRYNKIIVRDDYNGEFTAIGLEAQIIQHEVDHMDGILMIDRAPVRTGRNDPCGCGSGKKYKKCCLSKAEAHV